MGNTLITSRQNFNFDEKNPVARRVKQILTDHEVVLGLDKDFKEIKGKINEKRACCLGVYKKNPSDNEFITVKLPNTIDENDNYCLENGNCMPTQHIGMIIKGDPSECIKKGLYSGDGGGCDAFMTNYCAKDLHDKGCVICKKGTGKGTKKKCIPIWNSSNKSCFNPNPENPYLSHGPSECACVNSSAGFSLNNNPGNDIYGGFKKLRENPYDSRIGTNLNKFTKYSANVFNYDSTVQNPLVLDTVCASAAKNEGTKASGVSKPYLLSSYSADATICLNQINVGNSDINSLNFKNIRQNNSCGSSGGGKSGDELRKELDKKEEEVRKKNCDKIGIPSIDFPECTKNTIELRKEQLNKCKSLNIPLNICDSGKINDKLAEIKTNKKCSLEANLLGINNIKTCNELSQYKLKKKKADDLKNKKIPNEEIILEEDELPDEIDEPISLPKKTDKPINVQDSDEDNIFNEEDISDDSDDSETFVKNKPNYLLIGGIAFVVIIILILIFLNIKK